MDAQTLADVMGNTLALSKYQEEWRPIPGWEKYYEVSQWGNVRSLDREYIRSDGVLTRRKGRTLRPITNSSGRQQVYLCRPGGKQHAQQVHRLVLEAFVGPCPAGHEALHWNDSPLDNRLDNLRWGTRAENMADRVRNGRDPNASKTHCSMGHEFSPQNTYTTPRGGRVCKICRRNTERTYREKKNQERGE